MQVSSQMATAGSVADLGPLSFLRVTFALRAASRAATRSVPEGKRDSTSSANGSGANRGLVSVISEVVLMRRLQVLLIVGLACIAVGATSAYGKGDVRATLENPAQLQRAAPGERIRIVWMLTEAPQLPSLTTPGGVAPRPFGASGVYIRVRGAAGTAPRTFAAASASRAGVRSGRYVADVTVPTGGITGITIGLEGLSRHARASIHAGGRLLFDRQRSVHRRQSPGHRDQFRHRGERAVDPARRGPCWAGRAAGRESHTGDATHDDVDG